MNLNIQQTTFQRISSVEIPDIFFNRLKTNDENFDKIFGDGLLPGSSLTLTSVAGCGKSSFCYQLCERLCKQGYKAGYASGEESREQIAFTCKRLGVEDVVVANLTDIDALSDALDHYDLLVIDSFQALTSKHDTTVREREQYAVEKIVTKAKQTKCCVIFIVHITKTGQMKGSTLLPHSVDVNMRLDKDEESPDPTSRIITVEKNRWGPNGEHFCNLSRTGFTFSDRIAEEKPKKIDKKQLVMNRALQLLENGFVSEADIVEDCGVPKYIAYQALKELQDTMKVIKHGRGQTAVFELRK